MTAIREEPVYPLLTADDRAAVQKQLEAGHRYFYHFTLRSRLASIKAHGINPGFEGEDSRYGNRKREPANAMRYCTQNFVGVGLSAARTRNQVWDATADIWIPGEDSQLVLLRTSATSLLSRSFGLDHSFGDVNWAAEAILKSKPCLAPDEFIKLIDSYGSISCYAVIPPGELEICTDGSLSADGAFKSLTDDA